MEGLIFSAVVLIGIGAISLLAIIATSLIEIARNLKSLTLLERIRDDR